MNNLNPGTLSDAQIKRLQLCEYFNPNIDTSNISPSSIDLPMQKEVYRIARMTLPSKDETIRDAMVKMDATPITEGSILEVGSKYLIFLGKIEKTIS